MPDVHPNTMVFCAVAGHRNSDVSIRVIGFDAQRVEAELLRQVRTEQEYAASADGCQPDEIEMWYLGASELVLGDVSPARNTFDHADMVSGLLRDGIWVGGE